MKRLLIPSAALLWGLQFAFLSPTLALILVTLFDATAGEVGLVLAIYNISGFIATFILPAYADRKGDYLRPMLACGLLTLALAIVLGVTSSLPIAVIALVCSVDRRESGSPCCSRSSGTPAPARRTS